MNEEAKQKAKAMLPDVLRQRGIDFTKGKHFRCLNPAHNDRTPSMRYYDDSQKITCFGCGVTWDIFDLFAAETGKSGKELFTHVYNVLGISASTSSIMGKDVSRGEYEARRAAQAAKAAKEQEEKEARRAAFVANEMPKIKSAALRNIGGAITYLQRRGISAETAARHEIGYLQPFDAKAQGKWQAGAVLFFHDNTFEARNVDVNAEEGKRHFRPPGQAAELWNMAAIDEAAATMEGDAANVCPVFVVEGILDALSVEEAGGVAVALNSTANAKKFCEEVARRDVDKLPPVIIAMDGDDSGKKTAANIAAELGKKGVFFLQADGLYKVGGDDEDAPKDANEALICDKAAFVANVEKNEQKARAAFDEWRNKERYEYEGESLFVQTSDFLNTLEKPREKWATGFSALDTKMKGGLYPGLFLLGAPSGVGKTGFALQLAAQVAAAGGDVIYFSLEISREELIARELSRHSYAAAMKRDNENTAAMSHLEILNGGIPKGGRQFELLQTAYGEIAKYAENIHTITGVGDVTCKEVREAAQRHIKLIGKKPLVIIDYVQILQPIEKSMGIKESVDWNCLELKRISRDLDLPLLAISAFNRQSTTQQNPTLAAFRESSALEYTSDAALVLKPDYREALKQRGLSDENIREFATEGVSQEAQKNRSTIREINKERRKKAENGESVPVILEILKGRSTGEGEITLSFFGKFGLYRERK